MCCITVHVHRISEDRVCNPYLGRRQRIVESFVASRSLDRSPKKKKNQKQKTREHRNVAVGACCTEKIFGTLFHRPMVPHIDRTVPQRSRMRSQKRYCDEGYKKWFRSKNPFHSLFDAAPTDCERSEIVLPYTRTSTHTYVIDNNYNNGIRMHRMVITRAHAFSCSTEIRRRKYCYSQPPNRRYARRSRRPALCVHDAFAAKLYHKHPNFITIIRRSTCKISVPSCQTRIRNHAYGRQDYNCTSIVVSGTRPARVKTRDSTRYHICYYCITIEKKNNERTVDAWK